MHNSMFGRKLTCLLCDCQSDYRRRTSEKTNALTKKNSEKRISGTQDEGMGPLAPIRAFSDQYQGECIEHSLKQTEIPNFKGISHTEFKGNSHTCQYFAAAQACYIAKKGAI